MSYKRPSKDHGKPWTCMECRRRRPGYKPSRPAGNYEIRRCDVCQHPYQPRTPQSRTCGSECAKELSLTSRRNLNRARRAMILASRDLADPLTAEHEAAMRRAAKRCPMPGCGVKLTDRPFLPKSKELDHIVPRVLGGAHTIGNTRIICRLCNARRPDDGSDIDQMTLFSTLDPAAVAVALIPRVRQSKPQRQPRTCACGAPAFKSSPRGWCEGCRARIASEASIMRAGGAKWQDISDALGLGGSGAAYNLVMGYAAAA